jgi:hypothetical protein
LSSETCTKRRPMVTIEPGRSRHRPPRR